MVNIYLLVALLSMPVKFSKKIISILLPHKGEPKLWRATSATASHFKIMQFLHKYSSAPCTGSSFPYK